MNNGIFINNEAYSYLNTNEILSIKYHNFILIIIFGFKDILSVIVWPCG